MWEGLVRAPRGRISARKFVLLAASLLVAAFVNLFASSSPVMAADVEWKDDSTLSYDSRDYSGPTTAKENDPSGLTKDTVYFSSTEGDKGYLIYFKKGAEPKKATEAFFITADYDPASGRFSNLSPPQNITVTPAPEEDEEEETSPGESSQCEVTGIGYVICPISDWLAEQIDNIFDVIKGFFVVTPLTDGNNNLYRVWNAMREIANVLFIIGFLVIIYSYLTGSVLDNYSLKKILPRIVIAAIAINISYWICAILVDATNIAGTALNDLFMTMRESAVGTEKNTEIGWGETTAYVLSGGAVGTLGFMAAAGGSVSSLTFLIFAALIGAAFAVLVALIILAARQAIITVMIVIAPIAIAAYILPNTEQWFDRWRKSFLTLLMIFPAFGILFGGSQLASTIIMQNAPSIPVLILGLVVQVVPLVITPFLVQFSGGLLGKIAGMTNSSSRGLVDRSKNWARDRAEDQRQRSLGENARRWQLMRRGAQSLNDRKMASEDRRKNHETAARNRYQRGRAYAGIDQSRRELEHDKTNIDAGHEKQWRRQFDIQDSKFDQKLFDREVNTRVTSDRAKLAEERMNTTYQELRSGTNPYHAIGRAGPATWTMQGQIDEVSTTARDISIEALKKSSAETLENQNLTQALLGQENLRTYAGGARGLEGADSALAKAVASYRGDFGKGISEKAELMKHFNLSSTERQDVAMGATNVTKTRPDGSTYTFRIDDDYTREAAIEDQLKTGSFGQIEAIIESSGAGEVNADYALTISQAVVSNGLMNKALYWGAKTIDDISQGNYSHAVRPQAITYHISESKISDAQLAGQSPDAVQAIIDVINDPAEMSRLQQDPQKYQTFLNNYQGLRHAAWRIIHDDQLASASSEGTRNVLRSFMARPPS